MIHLHQSLLRQHSRRPINPHRRAILFPTTVARLPFAGRVPYALGEGRYVHDLAGLLVLRDQRANPGCGR